jgi:hypothetical protein
VLVPTSVRQRAAALLAGLLVLAAGITCTESPTGPRKSGVYALVGMSPVFSQAATRIYQRLASFELEIDNVHIRLERENGEVAVDTVVAITAGQDSIVIKLSVEILEGSQEQFEATLEFRDGTQVLFSGTQTITAALGFAPPAAPPITVEYTGPGATVTTLDVQPDTTISGLDDIQMRAIGRNANEQLVANLNLEWSVDNANLGSMTTAGVFQPTGTSGTATITAELPTGIQASATVTIASPPTTVVLISGGGQTGPVGATLEVPIVVEVRRADGSAVAGHSVSFAVTAGGGSVAPPGTTTAANGRANASLTLGTAPGTNTVQVTAAGLTPITVSATANAGPLHHILIVQQPSTSATSGQPLTTQPKVNLNDAFGNDIAQANVAITADLNPAAGYTLQGTTTRLTNASGIAEFTDLKISGPEGVTALRFSSSGAPSVTSQNISVTPAGPTIVTWTNPAGGFWQDGANWSTGVAPTSADQVVIDLPGTYNVAVNSNAAAASLTLGATTGLQSLTISSLATLTITGATSVGANAQLRVTPGTFASSGVLTNHGTLWIHGGAPQSDPNASIAFVNSSIDNRGLLLVWNGPSVINGALITSATSTIRLTNDNGNSSAGDTRLTVSDGFTNNGLIELISNTFGGNIRLTVTNGTLINAPGATVRSGVGSAEGTRTLTAQLDNRGLLDVEYPLTINQADADHANSGTLDITAANLTITQTGSSPTFTNSETITLGASRNFTVSGGVLNLTAGHVSGTPTSTLAVSGATLMFSTTTVTVPLNLSSTAISGDAINVPDGETLTLVNGGVASPITIAAGGTLVTHGNVELSTLLMPASTSTLRIYGKGFGGPATLTLESGFTNNGLIELTSDPGFAANLTVTNNTLTNASGGVIRAVADPSHGLRSLNANLNNTGTLDVEEDLQMGRSDSDITNTGTIDLSLGNLTVNQSGETPTFTNIGLMTLGAGRTWLVNGGGGLVDLDEGSIAGELSSRLLIFNASLAITTANIDEIPLTLAGTNIVGGSITVPTGELLTLWDGSLNDAVTVESGGTFLTHGQVTLGGTLTLVSGSVLRVSGQHGSTDATLTVTNGFTNNGLIELTSIQSNYSATLAVTNGTLTNAAGATVRATVGAGGNRVVAAQLNNQNGGTVDVDQALTLDRASSAHYNSGFIDLTNANLTVTQTGDSPSFGNGIIGIIGLGTGRQFIVDGGSLNLIGSSLVRPQSGHTNTSMVVTNAVLQFTPPRVTTAMTLVNTTVLGGSLTVGTGETVTLLHGGMSSAINLTGGTLLALGTVSLTGTVSITSGSILRVRGQTFGGDATLTHNNVAGLTNSGVIELTSANAVHSATLNVLSGTLTNAAGSTLLVDPGSGGARTIGAEVNNQGYLEANADVMIGRNGANHVNNSNLAANGGSITVSQTGGSFTNNASVSVSAGRVWTVQGALALNLNQGTVSGSASSILLTDGPTLALNPSSVQIPLMLVRTSIAGGSLTIGDAQIVRLMNGGLINADAIAVNSGGTLMVHGSVSLPSLSIEGGTVMVQGQNNGGDATLTVANGFTNNGVIELTSVDDLAFRATLAVTNGTLTNGVEASIHSTQGPIGGERVIAAQLNNQGGFVDVFHPLTINKPNAQHTNAANSIIRLWTGDLTITQSGSGQSFTNSGTIDLQGHTLTNTGGPFVNSLADAMTIRGPGTLNVGNTFLNNGDVQPNGMLNVTGNYLQSNPSGVLNIQISSSQSSACEVNDQVVATGSASLAGGLNVSLNDCLLTHNQTFTIVTAPSLTGTFNFTPISIQGGTLSIEYTSTQAILRFTTS